MAGSRRKALQGVGIVLVIAGIGLGLWGWQESQSLGNEVVAALDGGVSDEVMVRYILGAGFLALGLFLLFRR
ncbi:MAG: DUF3185 family protein [Halofilum sp. (in: g-proteobacteria)]|nr:DUF3185 family protein [Halofilum sp. (in: g-proteobacteria)]